MKFELILQIFEGDSKLYRWFFVYLFLLKNIDYYLANKIFYTFWLFKAEKKSNHKN